jgi:hypothetical protein
MGNLNVRNPEIRTPFIEQGSGGGGGGLLQNCLGLESRRKWCPTRRCLEY